MRASLLNGAVAAAALLFAGHAAAQSFNGLMGNPDADSNETEALFQEACATCHGVEQSGKMPSRYAMSQLTPRAIVAALESGVMREQGQALSGVQRIELAEHLTGSTYRDELLPAAAFCGDGGFDAPDVDSIAWMGWGGRRGNTGLQTVEQAGFSADDVPDLELRWAFAFPGATQARTNATVAGDRIIVGDQFGGVYAIDADTGCTHWAFTADSGIRGSVLVGKDAKGRTLAWFVDFRTNTYAVDTATGALAWRTRAGQHIESSNTGSPALHDGRLFVPITSTEGAIAQDPERECCTSSGALAALDATTGEKLWYHRVVAQPSVETGKNRLGVTTFGPSGAPVWSSPTIDPARGVVYIGTGENYTRPATDSSDAILAIDMRTGARVWSFQALEDDAWNLACGTGREANCPENYGPDLDFGMSPVIVTREDGKEILVVGQKSGDVWALDPDNEGELLWTASIGKGSTAGGVHWGITTDGEKVYVPIGDRLSEIARDIKPDQPVSPGMYALDLMTGKVAWSQPAPTDTCFDREGCIAAFSAAPSMIPGVVFSGGLDGYIRAWSAKDGSIIWQFDTTGDYETVNGVPGYGGALDGPAPVIANGLLLVNSGYGMFGQMPGNMLLAFSVKPAP
jgi:polyvinyl alcohol dehydrogenase (cytochrome)